MIGKRKVLVWACTAAMALLCAGLSFGQNPCGGVYKGEGLKATFWPTYSDLDPQNPDPNVLISFTGKILNDFGLIPYEYIVPGGDCVFLYDRGHIVVDVNRREKLDGTDEDRYVQIDLELAQNSGFCENTPGPLRLAHLHTVSFHVLTEKEFMGTRENGKLILSCTKYGWNYLNFATLTPGRTYYTQLSVTFMVYGDPNTYRFDTQAKVFFGDLVNSTGGPGWEITPIHKPYMVRVITMKGKKIAQIDNTDHFPSVYQAMGGCPEGAPWKPGPTWQPGDGVFFVPFKLVLERLK